MGGDSSGQFPLDRLHLHWLIPFSRTEMLLPCEVGEERLEMYPHLSEILWESLEEEHHLSDLISLLVPMSAPPPHLEEEIQMEGGSGYHPALKLLQDINQARAQLEYELIQEKEELAERYKHKWAKQARRHARQQAQMIDQTNDTFQEVFFWASLIEAVNLLPCCISAAVPFHYLSGAVTIAAQQDEGIPPMSKPCPTASKPESKPEPHGSLAPGTSGCLTPPPETPPLPASSLPDIPLAGTPLVGHLFSDFLAILSQRKQDHSPSGSLDHHHTKRTHVCSPEVEVGVEPNSTEGDQDMPELVQETWPRPISEQGGWELASPPSPSSATVGPVGGTMVGSLKSTEDPASSSSESSRVMWMTQTWI